MLPEIGWRANRRRLTSHVGTLGTHPFPFGEKRLDYVLGWLISQGGYKVQI